jgi:hypothetical protein
MCLTLAGIAVASSCVAQIGPDTVLTKAIADLLYEPKYSPIRTKYPVPGNWNGPSIDFDIYYHTNGVFSADLNPYTVRPADVDTYTVVYVDPINGSDQNSGTSKIRALRKLSVALALPGNKWILCRPGVFDFRTHWNGVTPTGNNVLEPWDETGYVVSTTEMPGLVWGAEGTIPNVYTAATSSAAWDIFDEFESDEYGVGKKLTKVNSVAAVGAQAGTFYASSKRVWVHLNDDRTPNEKLRTFAGTQNGASGNGSLWVRKFAFVGGGNAFNANNTQSGQQITFSDCLFWYGFSGDGLRVSGPANVHLFYCSAFGNFDDGFKITGGSRATINQCLSLVNGFGTGREYTGLTVSDQSSAVVIGGVYRRNKGPNISIEGNSKGILFGSTLGTSLGTTSTSVDLRIGTTSSDASIGWALNLTYEPGSTYCRSISVPSTLFFRQHRDSRPDITYSATALRPI